MIRQVSSGFGVRHLNAAWDPEDFSPALLPAHPERALMDSEPWP